MTDLTEIAREDIFGDKTIPTQVVKSLIKVIDYSFEDELENYNMCYLNNFERDDHIFTHLTNVNEWVNMLLDRDTHNINESLNAVRRT
jgi:hypothetical protein